MISKKELIIKFRNNEEDFQETFLEILLNDPLNDVEIDLDNPIDEIAVQLLQVDRAVLYDVFKRTEESFDLDDDYEEEDCD